MKYIAKSTPSPRRGFEAKVSDEKIWLSASHSIGILCRWDHYLRISEKLLPPCWSELTQRVAFSYSWHSHPAPIMHFRHASSWTPISSWRTESRRMNYEWHTKELWRWESAANENTLRENHNPPTQKLRIALDARCPHAHQTYYQGKAASCPSFASRSWCGWLAYRVPESVVHFKTSGTGRRVTDRRWEISPHDERTADIDHIVFWVSIAVTRGKATPIDLISYW